MVYAVDGYGFGQTVGTAEGSGVIRTLLGTQQVGNQNGGKDTDDGDDDKQLDKGKALGVVLHGGSPLCLALADRFI